ALGCEAALNPAIAVYLEKLGGLIGAALQPSAGASPLATAIALLNRKHYYSRPAYPVHPR
ncbi:hypothetical protein, partial [Pseudomonas proteolytica]|uniref:hypothetical protein n=1 Tax=Pseudomonas proteolytica TaxID=219574 RepID=UPI001CA45469